MFWLLLIGWGYAVSGLIVGFFLFAFYTIHAERCDNCVFGTDIPNWKTGTLLAKVGVILSLGSVLTWPLAILYSLFVAWPATKFERWFAKPKDNSIQSIVRAWYKRNRTKGWQIHLNMSDNLEIQKLTVQIYHSIPTASIRVSDEKCELEWRSAEGQWIHRSVSPSDPQFFNRLMNFMNAVSAGKSV